MRTTYNCVVIDDEPAPREILAKHIARHSALSLLKSFDDAQKALSYLRKNKADIVFLDIEMPQLSGIQLIENLDTEGMLFIFVTAHPQFAVDAFALDAVDYLSKPVSYERFTQAVKKALKRLEYMKEETLVLSVGKEHLQIDLNKIDWIMAENYYVNIHGHKFAAGPLIVRLPLYKLEKLLPQGKFFKISRSVIVGLHYIKKIRNNEVILRNGERFTVSRSYKYITGVIENKLLLQ